MKMPRRVKKWRRTHPHPRYERLIVRWWMRGTVEALMRATGLR